MPAVEMTARKQPAITAAVQSTIGE
jgi:hypothetical protein